MTLSNTMTFSDEQATLLEVASSFAREKASMSETRRQIPSELGFDRALWDEMAELGWPGIAVPEQFGGSGLSLAEVVTVVEPMSRHLAGSPFISTQMFAQGVKQGVAGVDGEFAALAVHFK